MGTADPIVRIPVNPDTSARSLTEYLSEAPRPKGAWLPGMVLSFYIVPLPACR
jgi:hypothetical protein